MDRVRLVRDHRAPDRAPLKVRVGDRLEIGELDTTWPAFRWCVRGAQSAGWVPDRHLRHTGPKAAVALAAYDTTELDADAGDILRVLQVDPESGWIWCADQHGREGWVPLDVVAKV